MLEPRLIATYADLLAATGDAPLVRHEVGEDLLAQPLALGRAVLFLREIQNGDIGAVALGPSDDVAALLATDWRTAPGFARCGLTVERVNRPVLVASGARGLGEWRTMVVDAAALQHRPVPSGCSVDRVVDKAEARAFVAAHYSDRWLAPTPRGEAWVGVRDADGRLLATGMTSMTPAAVPRLAGITVPPDQRGRGLGWQVTQALVELGLAVCDVVTLGVDDDNTTARALYGAMGFVTTHELSSAALPGRSSPGPDRRASGGDGLRE